MKKLLAIVLAALALASVSAADKPKTEIIVGAAASLTDAMNELVSLYQKAKPEVTVTPSYGSSGAIQKQIEQGAPVDVFIAAAAKQMDALESKGLLLAGTRKDLLANSLVLVTPLSGKALSSFKDLGSDAVKQVALGEPSSVPAGQYAAEVLAGLGILDAVQTKAVYAKDVRQVLAYVASGEVDAGVVYATDALSSKDVKVSATAPAGSHKPIVYPAAVIASSSKQSGAKDFIAWLSGPEASAVFVKFGFTTVK